VNPLHQPDDPARLSDHDLDRLLAELEARRPGAPVPSIGVRPRRRPWTYGEIRQLERLRAEARRRGRHVSG
jgi:hypothetical protein